MEAQMTQNFHHSNRKRRQEYVCKEDLMPRTDLSGGNQKYHDRSPNSTTSTNASEEFPSPRESFEGKTSAKMENFNLLSSSKKKRLFDCELGFDRNGGSSGRSSKPNKEKSQLCKKFMENGYCPYQKKCKFAHGSHELKKNFHTNSKYKTKECDVFIQEGCCIYGERCNFIHKNSSTKKIDQKLDFCLNDNDDKTETSYNWELLLIKLEKSGKNESKVLSWLKD